jgi:endonuclease/exonuclease/phosphatase family metal-dependent hydrolase
MLLDRAHAVSKTWNDAPVILCGDFNCTPKVTSSSAFLKSPDLVCLVFYGMFNLLYLL